MAKRKSNGSTPLTQKYYFDNVYFTQRWTDYYDPATSESEKFQIREEIVLASEKIARVIIKMSKLTQFASEDDLIQEAMFKVLRDFEKFDPTKQKKNKASAFVFLTTIIKNHLLTYIYKIRKGMMDTISIGSLGMDSNTQSTAADNVVFNSAMNFGSPGVGDDSRTVTSLVYHSKMFHYENVGAMFEILKDDPIGLEVLEYLGVAGFSDTEGLQFKKRDLTQIEPKKATLRGLLTFLRQNKQRPLKECNNYLREVKLQYEIFLFGELADDDEES